MNGSNELRVANGLASDAVVHGGRELLERTKLRADVQLLGLVEKDGQNGLRRAGVRDNLSREEQSRVVLGERRSLAIVNILEEEDESVDGPVKNLVNTLPLESCWHLLDLIERFIVELIEFFELNSLDADLCYELGKHAYKLYLVSILYCVEDIVMVGGCLYLPGSLSMVHHLLDIIM